MNSCKILLILFLSISSLVIGEEKLQLISVKKIWESSPHNAFTDLIEYKGALYLTFRESSEHEGGENGKIRVLKSLDGEKFCPIALISNEGIDLRDPKFSITPEDFLMLSIGGSTYKGEELIDINPYATFSKDGIDWTPLTKIDLPQKWIWSLSWKDGVGYGMAYYFSDIKDLKKPWHLSLYKTKDGIHYSLVTDLDVEKYPSEATLHFRPDGKMVALLRRRGLGLIGVSSPPYTDWSWKSAGTPLGGPNFLILPNSEMWAASRFIETTMVGPMTLDGYTPELLLPSGGDTGYPGMVYWKGDLFISYYSSHEDKTAIYLAKIKIK